MEKYPRSKRNRYNKQDSKVMLLTVMAAALVLLVLVMPKEPVQKALNVATGEVSSHAGLRISEVMSDNAAALPDETGGERSPLFNTIVAIGEFHAHCLRLVVHDAKIAEQLLDRAS